MPRPHGRLHVERLVCAPMIVELDLVTEHAHRVLLGHETFATDVQQRRRMALQAERHPPRSRFQRTLLTLVACLAVLPIAACEGQYLSEHPVKTGSHATADAPPLRNLNPAPRRAFEIRVALDDTPGPFVLARGVAQFDVKNPAECGERLPIAGVIPRITSNEPVVLTKRSDGVYTGTVYLDQILDEAYYGRGVCRWALVEARVALVGASDEYATKFVAGLPADVMADSGTELTHFWKGHYPRAMMTGYATFGNADLQHVPAEKRDEFFTVTMSAHQPADVGAHDDDAANRRHGPLQ